MSTPSASIGFPSGPSTPVPRASRDSTPHTQSAPLIRQVILRSLPPGHSLISTGPAQPAPAPPQYPSSTVDAIRSNDNDQANETLQVDPSDDEPDPESDADSQKSGDSWAAEVDKLLGKSQVKAKGKMKGSGKAKGKGKGKGKRQASSYELEKEANIARNKALGAELHAKWGVLQSEFEQPKTKSRAQAKKDKKAVAAEPQHRSQRQSEWVYIYYLLIFLLIRIPVLLLQSFFKSQSSRARFLLQLHPGYLLKACRLGSRVLSANYKP